MEKSRIMSDATQADHRQRILRVLVHIQQHLDETLELDDLARIACYSPYHFHRVFSALVGESLMEHVRRLRLERAAGRLKFTGQTVTRIAFEAGYETREAFTRAFRAHFCESPSGFRDAQRPLPLPPARSGVHYDDHGRVEHFQPVRPGEPMPDVTIQRLEPFRAAFMRHVGPYDQVGETWSRLMAWAGPRGLLGPSMKILGICHDDPEVTPPDRIRYDACVAVGAEFVPQGEIGAVDFPSGDHAMIVHHGPYDRLGETYFRLYGQWLPAGGRRPRAAPCFEVYVNSPFHTPPEKLVTQIYLPLEDQ